MPLVADVTSAALHENWHLHSSGVFQPGQSPSPYLKDSITPLVQAFLRKLNEIAQDYIGELSHGPSPRAPHYEDFFSLSYQAARSERDYTPNLAVVEFLRRLRTDTHLLHTGFKGGTQGGEGLSGLAETACDFLHWVVHHKLAQSSGPCIGLHSITDTAREVDEVDIFTLNHDLLVEKQCEARGFTVEDGFADRRGQLRAFNGWPAKRREKVRLLKLHGSINWFLYDFPGWARQYAISDGDPFHSCDQSGQFVYPVQGKAAFLSGTLVKEELYGLGFFGDVFRTFHNQLSRHCHLIVSGYGFGDPGVNRRLGQWLHDRPDNGNRLVVLNRGSPGDFFKNKGYWLQNAHNKGSLILIDKWLQDCTVADLAPYFGS